MSDHSTSQPLPGLTRRRLFAVGGAATAASLVPGNALASAGVLTGDSAAWPAHLRRSSYVGLTGSDFAVSRGGATARLTLEQVADIGDRSIAGSDDAFSLQFSGAAGAGLPEGVSSVSHPKLGRFEMFVAPVDRPGSRQAYEAIVDRSVGAPPRPPKAPAGTATEPRPPAPAGARPAIRRLTATRGPKGVTCNLVLRRGVKVDHVAAWLMRRDRPLAAASRAKVERRRLKLRLRPERRLRAVRYDVVVVVTDADGEMHSRRARVRRR